MHANLHFTLSIQQLACTSAALFCYVTQFSEGVQFAITEAAGLVSTAILVSTAKSVCFVTASPAGSIAQALSISHTVDLLPLGK